MISSSWQWMNVLLVAAAAIVATAAPAAAQQRRARPPEFDREAFRGIFFGDVTEAIQGERPRIGAMAPTAPTSTTTAGSSSATASPADAPGIAGSGSRWTSLARPVHLEDEIKRLKLRYDSLVTTPGRFRSGGFQDARATLTVMATLMAVIAEYDQRVRFKDDAAAARDLLARSARNVSAGSAEAFNEAKQRKADLQDLVSGTGLARGEAAGPTDWSLVSSRAPLMEYLDELLYDTLEGNSADAEAVAEAREELDRAAAMVAVVGQVLQQEGMDEADDPDYRQLSEAMLRTAMEVRDALAAEDAERAQQAVGRLGQSCSACHEQYR